MFKDYPSLHPLAIHFPIVLILLAVAFQAVVVIKPNWLQIRWAALFIMAGGFLSAWAASTLFHAMLAPNAPKSSWVAFNAHEKYAQYTLWMSGVVLLLKGIGDIYKLNRRSYDTIVLIAAIIAAIFLTVAGHHGATLTHIEGVGPMGRYLGTEEDEMIMENGGMKMGGDKKDSAMKMKDSMPGMKMPAMDSMKGMDTSASMKRKGNMNDMAGMKNETGKGNMKDMKGMGNMKDMPGMKNKTGNDNMNGMKGMKGMDKMKDMKGMDTVKNMQGMDNMQNMPGMDKTKGMDSMKNMKSMDMPGMKMPVKNPMDTFRFEDNNPALKKPKKRKQ